MKNLKILMGTVVCLWTLGAGLAQADVTPPSLLSPPAKKYFEKTGSGPDISGIPFIKNFMQGDAKFHYMGTRAGLHGFLLVMQGKLQIFYVTPDKKSVLIGALFADDGEIVSSKQMEALAKENKEIASILAGSVQQSADVLRANIQTGGFAEVPANAGAAKKEKTNIPLLITSPGERLIMDLQASSGVLLGNVKAPELLMVVSPNCSHCKKTWDGLSVAVKEGKLQVRLIPIARNPEGDEPRLAAQLLRSKDPLKAWESYLKGDKSALAGEPDVQAYRAVIANRAMTDRWNILGTPYLVYRNKEQTIKIVQGKPERTAAILLDLIQ